jgi:hypothetical protein
MCASSILKHRVVNQFLPLIKGEEAGFWPALAMKRFVGARFIAPCSLCAPARGLDQSSPYKVLGDFFHSFPRQRYKFQTCILMKCSNSSLPLIKGGGFVQRFHISSQHTQHFQTNVIREGKCYRFKCYTAVVLNEVLNLQSIAGTGDNRVKRGH